MNTLKNTAQSFFNHVQPAPPDAILGLNEAFKNDPNPEKINLTVGVYQDENGVTPVLDCIRAAEKRLIEQEKSKSYLGIQGSPEYASSVQNLIFGKENPVVTQARAATVQTPGGTGGLRVAGDFIKRQFDQARVWMSSPTWANHPAIFAASGLVTKSYTYLDADKTGLDFAGMKESLSESRPGDVLLLHGCCHNPTGVDLSVDQWSELAEWVRSRELLPLVDCAYQGFHKGLKEDVAGVLALCDAGLEVMVCSSFSKNLGLYGERVGAMTVVAQERSAAEAILSHVKSCIRVNYSNPPRHGAALATIVLNDAEFSRRWQDELSAIRSRIKQVRSLLVSEMNSRTEVDFSFIERQNGMFSFSGLTPVQVDQLRNEYSIYIVGGGRINVAGINARNIGRLCDSIAAVL